MPPLKLKYLLTVSTKGGNISSEIIFRLNTNQIFEVAEISISIHLITSNNSQCYFLFSVVMIVYK